MNISIQWMALIIAILAHAFSTVWWASKLSSRVDFMSQSIINIAKEIEKRDDQIKTIWVKIDSLKENQLKLEQKIR